MNIQTLIFGILACLVLFLAMIVIIVAFVGILRISIIATFDFDFVEWFKNRKKGKGEMMKDFYEKLFKTKGRNNQSS